MHVSSPFRPKSTFCLVSFLPVFSSSTMAAFSGRFSLSSAAGPNGNYNIAIHISLAPPQGGNDGSASMHGYTPPQRHPSPSSPSRILRNAEEVPPYPGQGSWVLCNDTGNGETWEWHPYHSHSLRPPRVVRPPPPPIPSSAAGSSGASHSSPPPPIPSSAASHSSPHDHVEVQGLRVWEERQPTAETSQCSATDHLPSGVDQPTEDDVAWVSKIMGDYRKTDWPDMDERWKRECAQEALEAKWKLSEQP